MQETDIVMNRISHFGMLVSNLINWTWQLLYLSPLALKYWLDGHLLLNLPALALYFLFLVIFVKESWMMISHFRLVTNTKICL